MPRSTTSSKTYETNKTRPKSIPPPPKPHTNVPGPAPAQQIQLKTAPPSFKETLAQGFAWGIGSSLGRRMFEPKVNPELEKSPTPSNPVILDSNEIFKKYQECLERNETNVSCEMLLDMSSK